jgi:hypothetical protein
LVTNVAWTNDAELARLVRGTESTKGWSDLGDGISFYKWLREHGSSRS